MIYFAISNVGLAIMMIVVYIRYSRSKILSAREVRDLRQRLDLEIEEKNNIQNKLLIESKDSHEKLITTLAEIDELRKTQEEEYKLRMEAEKQIALAVQRTDEMQKRMQDWAIIQEAAMKDSKYMISEMGEGIFNKMNESYKSEAESNNHLLKKVSEDISKFFDDISERRSVSKKFISDDNADEEDAGSGYVSESAERLMNDLVETMKANGQVINQDYFLPENIEKNKSKLFLCDAAFVKDERLYIIDLKASRYLAEYIKDGDKNLLSKRLDKYLSYLGNVKYLDSVIKSLSGSAINFNQDLIMIALPSKDKVQIMKEINYYQKAQKMGFAVMDFDEINNIIL